MTILVALLLIIIVFSYVISGRMGMTLFPKTEADYANVVVTLPFGTPVEKTQAIANQISESARRVIAKTPNGNLLLKGIFSEIAKKVVILPKCEFI